MITLYGSGFSRSFRALWALEEAGLEYQYVPLKIGSDQPGGSRTAEYLALNPQGKVPTLVHDDLVLTESAAIMNYIAALSPHAELAPKDTSARAIYDNVCFFIMTDLEQPLWTTGKHKFVLPEEHRFPKVIESAQWEFKRSLHALQFILADKEYVCDDRFTCADILLAQTLKWAERMNFTLPKEMADYSNRLFDRPACQRAINKGTAG